MTYEVRLSRQARKALAAATKPMQVRLVRRLDALRTDPHPADAVVIKGSDDLRRVRVGDYRIVYTVDGKQLRILIVRIGHRRDIYLQLDR